MEFHFDTITLFCVDLVLLYTIWKQTDNQNFMTILTSVEKRSFYNVSNGKDINDVSILFDRGKGEG